MHSLPKSTPNKKITTISSTTTTATTTTSSTTTTDNRLRQRLNMPIKEILYRFQPVQLYVVLVLSVFYFIVQLVLSHITHALTLLMAAYHMLCNIFALTGCIVTIKHSKLKTERRSGEQLNSPIADSCNTLANSKDKVIVLNMGTEEQSLAKRHCRELKLRNTFGWARIDILTMLIVCIILASLSFSLVVEALQTLVHIDHQDTMHLPIIVMILGFSGLILNGITYLLIGGYTMHQGSFLHVTPSGDVVLDRVMSNSGDLKALKPDERQLSKPNNSHSDKQLKENLKAEIGQVHVMPKRQGAVEMLRDVSSTIFVIVCAIIVYMAEDEEHTAKFIDPILSIFSCVLLVSLSYPYMKQSCLILLQTIPGSINMEDFERQLVTKFPQIVSYHDLHIWQLSAHKSVATVHIKFQNPTLYTKIIADVRDYFHERGITEVTIQPEFQCAKSTPSLDCLVQCNAADCIDKVCCKDSRTDLREVSTCPNGPSTDKDNSNHVSSTDEKQNTVATVAAASYEPKTDVQQTVVEQQVALEQQQTNVEQQIPVAESLENACTKVEIKASESQSDSNEEQTRADQQVVVEHDNVEKNS